MKLSQRRLARPSVGGMLATRQGSLTLALLCAVCAAGILIFALGRYKSGLKTVTPQTTVLVATAAIPKGTSGETVAAERLYKSVPMISSQLAAGAISDAAVLQGSIAQSDILPGQQLTSEDFAADAGVTGVLSPGERAVSVTIDEAHGDTDVVQAGDHVDIYSTFAVTKGTVSAPTMILLVPNALVIKPASSAATRAGGTSISGSSLVLAVPTNQAAEVAYASDNGKLYLTLRPTNASATQPVYLTTESIVAAASNATTYTGVNP